MVRLNWSTVFCFEWSYKAARTTQAFSVKDAANLGAEIVLISLTLKTGDEANDVRNVEVFSRLAHLVPGKYPAQKDRSYRRRPENPPGNGEDASPAGPQLLLDLYPFDETGKE